MESGRVSKSDRTYVPNRFRVLLHPADAGAVRRTTGRCSRRTLRTPSCGERACAATAWSRDRRSSCCRPERSARARSRVLADPLDPGLVRSAAAGLRTGRPGRPAPPRHPIPGRRPSRSWAPMDAQRPAASPSPAMCRSRRRRCPSPRGPPACRAAAGPRLPRPWCFHGPRGAGRPARGADRGAHRGSGRRNGQPWAFVFRGGVVRLGRGTDNEIVLPDDRVSRHHGQLTARQGTLVYTDLGSSNGSPGQRRARARDRPRRGRRGPGGELDADHPARRLTAPARRRGRPDAGPVGAADRLPGAHLPGAAARRAGARGATCAPRSGTSRPPWAGSWSSPRPMGQPEPGTSIPLDAVTSLGRDVNSTVVIDDDAGRGRPRPADLPRAGRGCWRTATGGEATRINGQPIAGRRRCCGYGDEIGLGDVRLAAGAGAGGGRGRADDASHPAQPGQAGLLARGHPAAAPDARARAAARGRAARWPSAGSASPRRAPGRSRSAGRGRCWSTSGRCSRCTSRSSSAAGGWTRSCCRWSGLLGGLSLLLMARLPQRPRRRGRSGRSSWA